MKTGEPFELVRGTSTEHVFFPFVGGKWVAVL